MGIFEKVIKIDDVKMKLYPTTFGTVELYPKGTKRTIRKLTIGGWKIINQVAKIDTDANIDSYHYFNRWKNIL